MRKEDKVYCNMCGKKMAGTLEKPLEDMLCVRKTWGYFSGKDGEIHGFDLCEACYDRLTKRFVLPVAVEAQKEML